jgi:hypothetical protein
MLFISSPVCNARKTSFKYIFTLKNKILFPMYENEICILISIGKFPLFLANFGEVLKAMFLPP